MPGYVCNWEVKVSGVKCLSMDNNAANCINIVLGAVDPSLSR